MNYKSYSSLGGREYKLNILKLNYDRLHPFLYGHSHYKEEMTKMSNPKLMQK